MNNKLFFSIVFFLSFIRLSSQELPWKNPNKRSILIDSKELKIDDFKSIIFDSFKFYDQNNQLIQNINYEIDSLNQTIKFSEELKNYKLNYFVNPDLITKIVFENDSSKILTFNQKRILTDIFQEKKKEKNPFDGISSKGSIIRGITFGNNQSASLKSSFDLQLSGNLSKEIKINASIYDHNIPIESGGYTQNINELDKILIELLHKNWSLRGGNLDLQQQTHYFSNFQQKVLGIEAGAKWETSNFINKIQVATSVSRGDFVSYKFIGQEGNQGPYKLQGKNNEQFIVIITGSEQIYLNGFLLTRGENKDYTINYNTGELTFMNQKLITSNSRITAEYLYTLQNYSRFLYLIQTSHESKNFKISTQFYSEGDQKNKPLNQILTDQDKERLSLAGNDTDLMFNSSEIETKYEQNRILYKKQIIQGQEIFEYSNNPKDVLYQVTFLKVSENSGDYILVNSPVNGRIYQYINPILGIKQGNYAPIKRLIAPQRLNVFSINTQFQHQNTNYKLDLSYSNKDKNLFSDKDNQKNHGFAGKLSINKIIKREKVVSENILELQFIQENFAIINRINTIEFNRDFNLEREFSNENQMRIQFLTQNTFYEKFKLKYGFNYIKENLVINGIKNDLEFNFLTKKIEVNSKISLLNSTNYSKINLNNEEKTTFLRYNNLIQKNIQKTNIGITFSGEKNLFKNNQSKEKKRNSFDWNEIAFFSKTIDSTKFTINSKIYLRKDDSIRNNKMTRLNTTYGALFSSQILNSKKQNLFSEIHFRKVNFDVENYSENILLATLKWNKKWLNEGLNTLILYELGSGREAQREFSYVKVTDGHGIYKWTDYNENGIEEINEFEVAEFSDLAKYIRVFTGNISFRLINKNKINFNLNIKPVYFFKKNKDFWQRISLNNSLQIMNSYTRINQIDFNPFDKTNLLFQNNSLISSIQFNQISINKWDLNLKKSEQKNMQFLYIGLESKNITSNQILINYKVLENHIFNSTFNFIEEISNSENFLNKRYLIQNNLMQFGYTYNLSKNFQTLFYYKNQDKKNIQGEEKLKWNELNSEIRWNDLNKTNFMASVSYIKTEFTGNSFSLVSNQMLEGFKPGNSFLWRVSIERNLTSYLQLNLNYEGRKNENLNTIHIGNVQIKANF